MNPLLVAQLLEAATQLIVMINQLRAGVITSDTAWQETKARFDASSAAWDAAVGNTSLVPAVIPAVTPAPSFRQAL
jgi:hypothetical protein